MKEEQTKFSYIDVNDARLKFSLYVNKITNEGATHQIQQKTCHLAAQNFLKFAQSQQYIKKNYQLLRELTLEKKSYYLLYLIDILLKNNRQFLSIARRDLQNMFKAVWQKVYHQQRKQVKLANMKAMARTWIVIYQKKIDIQQPLKKWLEEKYNTNLQLSERYKVLFQQNFEKNKQSDSKLQELFLQISKDDHTKQSANSLLELRNRLFQD